MQFAEHLRTLTAYNTWADNRIIASAQELTLGDLEADLGGYDTLLGTINHYRWAQLMWLKRLRGEANPPRQQLGPPEIWSELMRGDADLTDWAADLSDDDCQRFIEYQDTRGASHRRSIAPLVAHVVNHGTYHRGETALMLTRLGRSPGDLDYLYFMPEGA